MCNLFCVYLKILCNYVQSLLSLQHNLSVCLSKNIMQLRAIFITVYYNNAMSALCLYHIDSSIVLLVGQSSQREWAYGGRRAVSAGSITGANATTQGHRVHSQNPAHLCPRGDLPYRAQRFRGS